MSYCYYESTFDLPNPQECLRGIFRAPQKALFNILKKKELYFKYHELHPFKINRGFSDGPVVRTQSSNAGGLGSIPGGRTKST